MAFNSIRVQPKQNKATSFKGSQTNGPSVILDLIAKGVALNSKLIAAPANKNHPGQHKVNDCWATNFSMILGCSFKRATVGTAPPDFKFFPGQARENTQSGSHGLFLKIGKSTLPAPRVCPDGAASAEPVPPDSTRAGAGFLTQLQW
eukprot:3545130-Amphidinium_carterae.1